MLPELTKPAPFDLWVGSFDPRMAHITLAFPTANAAKLYAVTLSRPQTVSNIYTRVTTASGNICAGIYDDAGNRLATSGSIACPTAAVTIAIALTASVALSAAVRYWLALAADNTTVAFTAAAGAAIPPSVPGRITSGQVTTSFPLPDPIVLPTEQVAHSIGIWI